MIERLEKMLRKSLTLKPIWTISRDSLNPCVLWHKHWSTSAGFVPCDTYQQYSNMHFPLLGTRWRTNISVSLAAVCSWLSNRRPHQRSETMIKTRVFNKGRFKVSRLIAARCCLCVSIHSHPIEKILTSPHFPFYGNRGHHKSLIFFFSSLGVFYNSDAAPSPLKYVSGAVELRSVQTIRLPAGPAWPTPLHRPRRGGGASVRRLPSHWRTVGVEDRRENSRKRAGAAWRTV